MSASRAEEIDAPRPTVAKWSRPDRNFRPDVEGLRALAVALVVLFHVGVPGIGGGYVGVDVFFVISGFVITRLLLRQVETFGRPRFGEFYARRCRRIFPAAGLVALVTIIASYKWLGFIRGNEIADDGRWVSVFLANNHFASVGTNYFQSQLPASPLQNYWSLAVEEQFYVVYPAAIALICLVGRKLSIETKMLVFTGSVFVGSLVWSVHYTATNSTGAYFATATHAWELALGGFVAAGTRMWTRIGPRFAAALGWAGLCAVMGAAAVLSSTTEYPGWVAIFPVVGAALIIVGGTTAKRTGPEAVLGTGVMRWLGKLSFSIYLLHWPILTIAQQDASAPLSLLHKLGLAGAAVAGAAIVYYLVENPLRHSRFLAKSPRLSIAMGLLVVAAILVTATYEIHSHPGFL